MRKGKSTLNRKPLITHSIHSLPTEDFTSQINADDDEPSKTAIVFIQQATDDLNLFLKANNNLYRAVNESESTNDVKVE